MLDNWRPIFLVAALVLAVIWSVFFRRPRLLDDFGIEVRRRNNRIFYVSSAIVLFGVALACYAPQPFNREGPESNVALTVGLLVAIYGFGVGARTRFVDIELSYRASGTGSWSDRDLAIAVSLPRALKVYGLIFLGFGIVGAIIFWWAVRTPPSIL